jgi:hypothetical protein
MSISLRQALRLAVGPANVDAAGHAVADWFDGFNCFGAADMIREALRDQPDQPAPDAVPHDRPDTSLRAELLQKLATQREVLLSLCDRVDRLEMRADGLTPIERVQRRWAQEADGPAVQSREPASVVDEPSDEELLGLDQLEAAWNAQADSANGWNELGLDEIIAWAQRQALARWGHQPVPPAEGEVGEGPSDEAEANFTAWFCRNYPGPDTIIHRPELHGPKVFRAAAYALARWNRPAAPPAGEVQP